MSDAASQTFPTVRDQIDALKAELAAEREEYFERHPERRAIYEADAAKDLPTLRRELAAEREEYFERHPERRVIYEADAAKDLPTLRREFAAERENREAERRRRWADR